YDPAKAVKLTTAGLVVPDSGSMYNGISRVGGQIPSNTAYLLPNANDAALLAVPAGLPRGLFPWTRDWAPGFGFAYSLDQKTVLPGGFGRSMTISPAIPRSLP